LSNKKRKLGYENRSFKTDWELKYFFINQNEKLICLVCNNSVAAFKVSNIKRHYDILHAKSYDNLVGFLEKKSSMNLRINSNLSKISLLNKSQSMKASFSLTQIIINKSKAFS
jgi:hypothetical protein